MTAPEVTVIAGIQKKLDERFPNLISLALDEFRELHQDILDSPHINQVFYGWLFQEFCLTDGKSIPAVCFETLTLDDTERRLLHNIRRAIHGFFEVLGSKDKIIYLQDMLTKKEYAVITIDLDPMPQKGVFLETSLVKNLKDCYFFFGGFFYRDEQEGTRLNLLEYTRELTVDELVAREMGMIKQMKKIWQKALLISYLRDTMDFDKRDTRIFFNASEQKQEEMIRKSVIKTVRSEEDNDFGAE